ncbi:MAG: ribonuclease PH [Deltaproteobacteria bacterium]|nr:ribonuclease PH [Deltaproteobacteria bacterium]
MRRDRHQEALREIKLDVDFLHSASNGSLLISMGNTRVICAATLIEGVPQFLRGSGRGWLTAEYAMLPSATEIRAPRETVRGVGGRTHEIQRLIGRALRAVVNLDLLGERTIHVDCDVIQADGGTRTAAISGAFIALAMLIRKAQERGDITTTPIRDYIAAVSVGIVDGEVLLDLDYSEDSRAEVDANVVMTGAGKFVEIQSTAEGETFSADAFARMLKIAQVGIAVLIAKQKEVVGGL